MKKDSDLAAADMMADSTELTESIFENATGDFIDNIANADQFTAAVVAEYLQAHPDFFKNRQELLDQLALSRTEQGTISLVQIQLARQRKKIEALEEEITTFMSLATNNDRTFHEFMTLQEQVLNCQTFQEVITAIKQQAQVLGLQAYVRLTNIGESITKLSLESYQRFATNHLNGKTAYLGRLRKADRELLFLDASIVPEMGSYVVLPLGKNTAGASQTSNFQSNTFQSKNSQENSSQTNSLKVMGLLIFSSIDGGHFLPEMDTLFLRHLSLVVTHLAQTLPWSSNEHNLTSITE